MNGVNKAVYLSLSLVVLQFRSKDATQYEPSQEYNMFGYDYSIKEWYYRPYCPSGCGCRPLWQGMMCDGTIPDTIPSGETDILLCEIPWTALENQKRFCHSSWSNVEKLDIVFTSDSDIIARGVFLNNEFDCLENLQYLRFGDASNKVNPMHVKMSGLEQLQYLKVAKAANKVKPMHVKMKFSKTAFSCLKNLKSLDLSYVNFNFTNLQDVLAVPEILPNLTSLILDDTNNYWYSAASPYRYSKDMHALQFNQSFIESLSMRPLQDLHVNGWILEFYFHSIKALCNNLKKLTLVNSYIQVTSLELDNCNSLDLVDISGSNLLQLSFKLHEKSPNIIGCVNRFVPLAKGIGFHLPRKVIAERMFRHPNQYEIINCTLYLDLSCTEELVFTYNQIPQFELIFAIQCLRFIDLSNNYIAAINADAMKFLTDLEKVDLSYNEFGKTFTYFSTHTNKLGSIKFALNETNLGTVFHYNNKLSVINIAHNQLSTLPDDTFVSNPELVHINLSFNSFLQIHFKISHLLHLEMLDLRHNKIKFLDSTSRDEVDELYKRQAKARRELKDNNTLQILLDGNPFLCGCHLYEFHLWFDTAPFLETTKHNSYCVTVVDNKKIPMSRSAVYAAEECQRHTLTPMYFQYLYIKCSNFVKQNALKLSIAAGTLMLTSIGICAYLYYIKTLNQRFFKTKPIRKGGRSRLSTQDSAMQLELGAQKTVEEPSRPGSFLQLEDRRSLVTDCQLILDASTSIGKLYGFGIAGTCFRVGETYIMTAWHIINDIVLEGHGISSDPSFAVLENTDVYVDFGFLSNASTMEKAYLTSNVVFRNESLDIAIVKLRTLGSQALPEPLTLCKNTLLHVEDQFTFVGHPGGEIKQLNSIDGFVQLTNEQKKKAVKFSHQVTGTDGFDGIDNPERILFHCSFQKGGSGSPGLVVVGNIPVVITVLLHGYPDWFYDSKVDKRIKDTVHNHNKIEQGVLMESLYQLFHKESPKLCEDIFRANVGIPMDVE